MKPLELDVAHVQEWAREARSAGASWEWMCVIDHEATAEPGERWEVVFAVRQRNGDLLTCAFKPGHWAAWPTLREVWAGAGWHEDEAAALFGVTWAATSEGGCAGFGLQGQGVALRSLRKDVMLVPRSVTPWPGAVGEGSGTRRQRFLPSGVPGDGVILDAGGQVLNGSN